MKGLLKDIAAILTPGEKRKFSRIILLDVCTSVLDIAFLAMLVFVVGFYTRNFDAANLPGWLQQTLQQQPLLLITSFTILYALKNALGFLAFRKQFKFVYEVASRISGNNLSAYLDGSYQDYVTID